jgi:hypothetical protein
MIRKVEQVIFGQALRIQKTCFIFNSASGPLTGRPNDIRRFLDRGVNTPEQLIVSALCGA